MVFSPNLDAIDIFATPLRDGDKFRYFLFRLGRGDLVQSEGAIAIMVAPPQGDAGDPPPATTAYTVLGVDQ